MSKKQKKENAEDTTIVELVETFRNATGIEFLKEGVKWISTGIFMGTSDAIPGYSGGTTLAILGFFKRLILIAKSVFIPEPGITRFKALLFMLPFSIGWMAGVFGFAKLTELMARNNMGLELLFFFSPFVLFAIPIFLRSEKPNLWSKKESKITLKKTNRWWFFLLGFVIVISVAIGTLIGRGGVNFTDRLNNYHYYLRGNGWIILVIVSFIAGMVALIPGGSGAIIQLLSGMYDKIHWKIMAHASNNFLALVIFASSTFMGMLLMVFIMSWGLKKHEKSLASLSLGMLIASIFAILIIPKSTIWQNLRHWEHVVGVVFAWLSGASLGFLLNLYIKKSLNKKSTNMYKITDNG